MVVNNVVPELQCVMNNRCAGHVTDFTHLNTFLSSLSSWLSESITEDLLPLRSYGRSAAGASLRQATLNTAAMPYGEIHGCKPEQPRMANWDH
jgi:hypothetical protein